MLKNNFKVLLLSLHLRSSWIITIFDDYGQRLHIGRPYPWQDLSHGKHALTITFPLCSQSCFDGSIREY